MRRLHTPLTASGVSASVLATTSIAAGWWFGWVEFFVLGVGCLSALILSLGFVVGGDRVQVTRQIQPTRTQVGESATSLLTIVGRSGRPLAARAIRDRVGNDIQTIRFPGSGPNTSWCHEQRLPTDQRGELILGPAEIAKSDPFGLASRELGQTGVVSLLVHPRSVLLKPMRSGFMKDLDGPTSDHSPAGDAAFHAIRPFAPGDDLRHVHWMSTARVGVPMIRQYVDNRQPLLAVVVDDSDGVADQQFEMALEAAASNVISAARDGRPLSLWVGDQQVLSAHRPACSDRALDRLAKLQRSASAVSPPLHATIERAHRIDPLLTSILLITGETPTDRLVAASSIDRWAGQSIAVRFVEGRSSSRQLTGVRVFDCSDLNDFVAAWAQVAE